MSELTQTPMSGVHSHNLNSNIIDFKEVNHSDYADTSLDMDLPEKPRPYFLLHLDKGEWGSAGVYLYPAAKNGSTLLPPIRICAPLIVLAQVCDLTSNEWGRLLQWYDHDGNAKSLLLKDSLLVGEPGPILAPLASGGLEIVSRYKRDIVQYISSCQTEHRATTVKKAGWVNESVYVSPFFIVNEHDDTTYLLEDGLHKTNKTTKGTLATWQREVASVCQGNSRLMFAMSCAFAGTLLKPLNQSGGGFHFQGCSSIGKSLSMLVAASVISEPQSCVTSWRTTDNGLEGIAVAHNDGLLMLDELSQVNGAKAGEIAYMLANGQGKIRGNRDGSARMPAQWNLMFLSNGEVDLANHMKASGTKKSMAGQEVRMLTIPADANKGHGIFENLHGELNGESMARRVKVAVNDHYGVALAAYVKVVASSWESIRKEGTAFIKNFVKRNVPEQSDSQVIRAAERFALVAYAGELATKAGITGWSPGSANEAASICFKAWIAQRGGVGSIEEAQIVQRLLDTLSHSSARFESMQDALQNEQSRVANRLGFIDGGTYSIPVSGFNEIMGDFNIAFAAEVLKDKGIIKHEIGKGLPRVSLPGLGRRRCYRIHIDDLPDQS